MMPSDDPERDLRAYARATQRRLVLGAVLLLLLVGTGLIALFQGSEAVVGALLCFAVVLMPVGLIFLVLQLVDWAARRARDD